jgi:hypothetical protein
MTFFIASPAQIQVFLFPDVMASKKTVSEKAFQ